MPRGSKPGERRGGRKKGTPNKATAGLKAAFQKHETALVKALLALTKSTDEQVRLRAIQLCLERGWGRPAQTVELPDQGASIVAIERIIIRAEPALENDGPTLEHANGTGDLAPPVTLLSPHDDGDGGSAV